MTQAWNLNQEEIFSEGFATTPWPQSIFYPERRQHLSDRNSQEKYTGRPGTLFLVQRVFEKKIQRGISISGCLDNLGYPAAQLYCLKLL